MERLHWHLIGWGRARVPCLVCCSLGKTGWALPVARSTALRTSELGGPASTFGLKFLGGMVMVLTRVSIYPTTASFLVRFHILQLLQPLLEGIECVAGLEIEFSHAPDHSPEGSQFTCIHIDLFQSNNKG